MKGTPRKLTIPVGCALGCITATQKLCLCHCEGANHGIHKWEWPGNFCEDCGIPFGTKDPFRNGCYVSCGTSQKYLSRTGTGYASACYCGPCYLKKRGPDLKAQMDRFRRDLGISVSA